MFRSLANNVLNARTNRINAPIYSIFAFLFLNASLVYADQQKSLIINSGSSAPLIISDSEGFYPVLVKELFKRMDLEARTILMPSARSLRNGNNGVDDGIIARIKGIEKKFTNLVPVPEKIIDLEFVSYSNDKDISIRSWDELKNYRVGYIRGWKIYDNKVKAYKTIEKAKNPKQLFLLLKKNRVDVILYQDIPGQYWMNKLGFHPSKGLHALAQRDMYLYMHKRHAKLVPTIAAELKKMKQDGSYEALYRKHITELLRDTHP